MKPVHAAALSTAAATVAASATLAAVASAHLVPGTPARDVHLGPDADNASNPFVQPPGVRTRLHMDNADVVFGRDNADLLVGRLGNDTVVGGPGADILVGGPDRSDPDASSDVLLGDEGRDIALWAPGDGNDAVVGDLGADVMVMAPLQRRGGDLVLERHRHRQVPRAVIGGRRGTGCDVITAPPREHFGAQYLVRFQVRGEPVGSVRLKEVERLVCPSPREGYAEVARLTSDEVSLHRTPVADLRGAVLRAILAP